MLTEQAPTHSVQPPIQFARAPQQAPIASAAAHLGSAAGVGSLTGAQGAGVGTSASLSSLFGGMFGSHSGSSLTAGAAAAEQGIAKTMGTVGHSLAGGLGLSNGAAAIGASEGMRAAQGKTGEDGSKAATLGTMAGLARAGSSGEAQNVAPALKAAAEGASVAEQTRKLGSSVALSAGDALRTRMALRQDTRGDDSGQTNPGVAAQEAKYHSPYVGTLMAGIQTDAAHAKDFDEQINGHDTHDTSNSSYAAYGGASQLHDRTITATENFGVGPIGASTSQDLFKIGASDMGMISDVAAVTQYGAAANQGVRIEKGPDGQPQVNVDWNTLDKIPIKSNMHLAVNGQELLGNQQATYASPGQMATQGADTVIANMKEHGKDPQDKGQFIALTGHSGGGQSSFYTALKLAKEGYTNLSVAGVDMAMTPYERQALEALGVKVTNITSHTNDAAGNQQLSEIGDFIRTGMGGGANYYDLNVTRQASTEKSDLFSRHDLANDANVASMVRFAQYLDANGQHGQYSKAAYDQFLKANPGADKDDAQSNSRKADPDLFDSKSGALNSNKIQDNRCKSSATGNNEADFQNWLRFFVNRTMDGAIDSKNTNLHVDIPYGFGSLPIDYNYKPLLDQTVSNIVAGNDGNIAQLGQGMGIDTSNIHGLQSYNADNPSQHWGNFKSDDLSVPNSARISVAPFIDAYANVNLSGKNSP